jgi:hypothetical protein
MKFGIDNSSWLDGPDHAEALQSEGRDRAKASSAGTSS